MFVGYAGAAKTSLHGRDQRLLAASTRETLFKGPRCFLHWELFTGIDLSTSAPIKPIHLKPCYLSRRLGVRPSVTRTLCDRRLPLRRVRDPRNERSIRCVLSKLENRLRGRIAQRFTERPVPDDVWSRHRIDGPTVGEKPGAHGAGHFSRREGIRPGQVVRSKSCDLESCLR